MNRQGAGTSVPAPLAYPAACWAGLLGVPCWAGLHCAPVGGTRPLAVRAVSFARRVVSKPGQAPPPPTGTAARPSGPSGGLHIGGVGCVDVLLGPSNFARNSPGDISNHEFVSLVLQRFGTFLKNDRGKLCETFG